MHVAKLLHYAKKIHQAGPKKSVEVIQRRSAALVFQWYWRTRAVRKKAASNYTFVIKFFELSDPHCLLQTRKKVIQLSSDAIIQENISHEELIKQADSFVNKTFDILGSGPMTHIRMPWHEDIRLRAQQKNSAYQFDPTMYYNDIKVAAGADESLVKDIKVPWELSRFQHLVVLGCAYKQTGNEAYADAFTEQVSDWMKDNPFLLGVNWKSPMEIGIRATNWVWAFSLFQDAPSIKETFWKDFIASLFDHMIYLENNWEVYDGRTSNHYLSDLVGYMYLCYFFQGLSGSKEKQEWCVRAWLAELEKQVFTEGTDYEGSTRYHTLVTEIFYHLELITLELGISIPQSAHEKIGRMIDFIDWCTPVNGDLISIGDHDSGTLLYFQPFMPFYKDGSADSDLKYLHQDTKISLRNNIKHFQQFGITIVRTNEWHFSFRHHAYKQYQPSGHFHNDLLGITLAHNGISIFTDPGSYVYTPSKIWRNQFRSVTNHNTFYIEGGEPVEFNDDDELFELCLSEHEPSVKIESLDGGYSMGSFHDLYIRLGLRAHRTVELNIDAGIIVITDYWEALRPSAHLDRTWVWNFTVAPHCSVQKFVDKIIIANNNIPCVQIESELVYNIHNAYVSLEYGSMVPSKRIRAQRQLKTDTKVVTIVRRIQ